LMFAADRAAAEVIDQPLHGVQLLDACALCGRPLGAGERSLVGRRARSACGSVDVTRAAPRNGSSRCQACAARLQCCLPVCVCVCVCVVVSLARPVARWSRLSLCPWRRRSRRASRVGPTRLASPRLASVLVAGRSWPPHEQSESRLRRPAPTDISWLRLSAKHTAAKSTADQHTSREGCRGRPVRIRLAGAWPEARAKTHAPCGMQHMHACAGQR